MEGVFETEDFVRSGFTLTQQAPFFCLQESEKKRLLRKQLLKAAKT